jgi:hypothetical protein
VWSKKCSKACSERRKEGRGRCGPPTRAPRCARQPLLFPPALYSYLFEVRHVRLVARALDELSHRQDARPERRDVLFERFARDLDDILLEEDAHHALGILPVAHAPKRGIFAPQVGALRVGEHVLGAARVARAVGHEGGGAPQAEQAVDDEHGPVLADVPVVGDVFVVDDQDAAVGQGLESGREEEMVGSETNKTKKVTSFSSPSLHFSYLEHVLGHVDADKRR